MIIINQEETAQSPEQLMRSRYSAYATKAADYIYNTYAQSSRILQSVNDISAWANETRWLKLTVHAASEFTVNNKDHSFPTVCFSAYYQHQGGYFHMKETSRFIMEDDQWRYLEGEVSHNEELVTPKRNERCFCHSDKKFKQCCGS